MVLLIILTSKGDSVSEITPCNYCSLNKIKKNAKDQGLIVTNIGRHYYKHPPKVDINLLDEKERRKYFSAWFMELTNHCCC